MPDNPILLTSSEIDGVRKRVYANYRVNQFPMATPLMAQIRKGKAGGPERLRWGGDGVYFDTVLTRPVGANFSQLGYFSQSAAATEVQATLGIKRMYVVREIDALADYGTSSKEAAFISVGRKMAQEALAAAKLAQEETWMGAGTGVKALIGTASSATSIVVEDPYGVDGAGQGGLWLDVGMYVAVLDATDSFATVLGRATITAVSNSGDNCTLTLEAPGITGMAAGDAVVACSPSDTSYNNVPNGLINICNLGGSYASVCGISASNHARWNTKRMVAGTDTDSAAELTEMDVWELFARQEGFSGKSPLTSPEEFLAVTTPGLERNLGEQFLAERHFNAPVMDLKGGFKAVQICGVPVIRVPTCPAGTFYSLHVPSLLWVDMMDTQRVQFEDSGSIRFIDGRDAFSWAIKQYWNTGTTQRNAHAAITGVTDTRRYSWVA